MFPHQAINTHLSCLICIPHEFVPTRYGMIQFHLETICCDVICLHETLDMYCNEIDLCFFTKHSMLVCPAWYASRTSSFRHDTVWYNFMSRLYAVMSFVCTKHSICIVMKCIYVSSPNTRCLFVPHDMQPARVTRNGMIQFHLEFDTRRYAIMSLVCTKHSICIVTICIYVTAPNTRCLFVPHDMHPAGINFDTIWYDTISSRSRYEVICCHVICLHETLDMYCNNMYSCFRTNKYAFVLFDMHPARVRSDTIRYDTISCRDYMLSCHLSARNTWYVL